MLHRGAAYLTKAIAMHCRLARLAALLLSTAALGGCSTFFSGSSDASAPKSAETTASAETTTLDGEIRQAQLSRVQGDYPGAVHALSQLMLVAPDDPRVVGEYGKVLVQQGRASEALQFLDRAVELQSNDWTLYSAMGVAYDETNHPAEAREAYQHALILKPGEAVVLNNYALSRMMAGDPAEARKLIEQASTSGDPKIARNLALIDGLAGAKAEPSAVATAAPAPTPAATHEQTATLPPKPLTTPKPLAAPTPIAAAKPGAKTAQAADTVVMQSVPVDLLAGPVAKHAAHKPAAKPHKLAAKPQKTPAQAAKNSIPALRLANDRP
jgi:Flp pilus assembly protein TadD